jgi:CMP-N-acetylneuraminic acid synthetase|tara:strand:- start:218 stop:916 length:699 start_codon:yes stop_codon:yes gene_type:complete
MIKKNICLIPARGGSKRVKNKNIKKFLGKPLLERVIKTAKKSNLFDKIYVSTDSILIKKLAIKCGAFVPYIRSKELSNDSAILKSVIDDFLNKVILSQKTHKMNLFVLYPTSIFVDKKLIMKCNKMLKKTEYVTTIKKFPHPIQRALKYYKKKLKPINLKHKLMRTQDLEEYYYNAGQIDCFKIDAWLKKKMFHKMYAKFVLLNDFDSIDIDTPDDLKLAYKLFNLNKKKFK